MKTVATLALALIPLTSGQNLRARREQASILDFPAPVATTPAVADPIVIFQAEAAPTETAANNAECKKFIRYAQQWTMESASAVEVGQVWSFSGDLYDRRKGGIVGSATEVCTKFDRASRTWICEGTVVNPDGCEGQFSFAGTFSEEVFQGNYFITTGTGQFEGVTGTIKEKFGPKTLVSRFEVSMN